MFSYIINFVLIKFDFWTFYLSTDISMTQEINYANSGGIAIMKVIIFLISPLSLPFGVLMVGGMYILRFLVWLLT